MLTRRDIRRLAVASLGMLVTVQVPAWGIAPLAAPVRPVAGRIDEGQPGAPVDLCVLEDHARHEGEFLVLNGFVKNVSNRTASGVELSVELYGASGQLVDVEDSVVRPDRFGPGQKGSMLIVAPYRDGIDKVRYLLTWEEAGGERQGTAARRVALGSGETATRTR